MQKESAGTTKRRLGDICAGKVDDLIAEDKGVGLERVAHDIPSEGGVGAGKVGTLWVRFGLGVPGAGAYSGLVGKLIGIVNGEVHGGVAFGIGCDGHVRDLVWLARESHGGGGESKENGKQQKTSKPTTFKNGSTFMTGHSAIHLVVPKSDPISAQCSQEDIGTEVVSSYRFQVARNRREMARWKIDQTAVTGCHAAPIMAEFDGEGELVYLGLASLACSLPCDVRSRRCRKLTDEARCKQPSEEPFSDGTTHSCRSRQESQDRDLGWCISKNAGSGLFKGLLHVTIVHSFAMTSPFYRDIEYLEVYPVGSKQMCCDLSPNNRAVLHFSDASNLHDRAERG
nr:hypothetical protein CFP56_31000 [Quercus suber]